jgi:hypothetical protein
MARTGRRITSAESCDRRAGPRWLGPVSLSIDSPLRYRAARVAPAPGVCRTEFEARSALLPLPSRPARWAAWRGGARCPLAAAANGQVPVALQRAVAGLIERDLRARVGGQRRSQSTRANSQCAERGPWLAAQAGGVAWTSALSQPPLGRAAGIPDRAMQTGRRIRSPSVAFACAHPTDLHPRRWLLAAFSLSSWSRRLHD